MATSSPFQCSCLGGRPTVDGLAALRGAVQTPAGYNPSSVPTCLCPCSKFAADNLLVVVLEFSRWVIDAPPTPPRLVNCPPTCTLGTGMACRSVLSSPTGWNTRAIPAEVLSGWPQACSARAVQFDFGGAGCCGLPGSVAQATLTATTTGGCPATANLKFQYGWSVGPGPAQATATFSLLELSHSGIAFKVLDDTTFLTGSACQMSIVVLALQQDCTTPGLDLYALPAGACEGGACGPSPGTLVRVPPCTVGPCGPPPQYTLVGAPPG